MRKKQLLLGTGVLLAGLFSFQLFPVFAIAGQWSSNGTSMYYSDGNIGIGTSSPETNLHVAGNLKIGKGYNNVNTKLTLYGANQPGGVGSYQDISFDFNSAGSAVIRSYRDTSWGTHLELKTNANDATGNIPTTRMHITPDGKIGVGKDNPVQKLDVAGNVEAGTPSGGYWGGFRSNATSGIWGFNQANQFLAGVGGNLYSRGFSNNAMGIFNASGTAEDIFLYNQNTGASSFLVLKSNGNVGINTTNPTHRLSVNGSIRAKEVVVNTGWADYVFEDNYQLISLSQLASFIKENKHLPNIPSTSEIESSGLSLGEMQKLHMEKIEELTLHLIEKDKEIKSLEERILKLESLLVK